MGRIDYLDGLRGVAILLVLFFHAYARWTEVVPYGEVYSEFPLFKYGYLGVQLFFLISGFVILMSLEKCSNATVFVYKRWLRLFPAMLICSVVVFLSSGFFYERPAGSPNVIDLVPGLSFVEPYVWWKVTGLEMRSIEDAYWSIYVEFKFYIVAALLYYWLGSSRLVAALFCCFIVWVLVDRFAGDITYAPVALLYSIVELLSFKYFGWFCAGAACYMFKKTSNDSWLISGAICSLFSSFVEGGSEQGSLVACISISVLFFSVMVFRGVQRLLSNRLCLFLGFVSYPLYLMHENMMISLIVKIDGAISFVPDIFLPVLSVAFVVFIAYLVAKFAEPKMKSFLINCVGMGKLIKSV